MKNILNLNLTILLRNKKNHWSSHHHCMNNQQLLNHHIKKLILNKSTKRISLLNLPHLFPPMKEMINKNQTFKMIENLMKFGNLGVILVMEVYLQL